MALKVLFVTNLWPDEARPWHGPFVKREADALEAIGVEVDALPIRGYASRTAYFKAAPSVAKLNWDCPYDVVHAHWGYPGLIARLQVRAPLVVTYWGSDLLAKRRPNGSLTVKSRIEVAVFRQLARVAAATITQSDEMERALPRSCRERNSIIPGGIDLERFRPIPLQAARQQLGWDRDEKVVLFAGNPNLVVKNYPLAQEVHRRVSRTVTNLRLRVAWGVAPDEIPLWMSAADALLFPSRSEGSPNVVKEAMASELPVVSTPVGDVEERLRGVPGCFVRPPDPDALSEALVAALDHGRATEARRAVEPLAPSNTARQILSVYESVLDGR